MPLVARGNLRVTQNPDGYIELLQLDTGLALVLSPKEWEDFKTGVKAGDFDLLWP